MKKEFGKKLRHSISKIKTGGEVIVLDNGAIIGAEAEAMLQALHSRSTGGLKSHLKILNKTGADKFMNNFYVGYGHKSIGDCGSATIFIEGVSMLTAKAIQDWPLYSGQESSTRYIDFAKQRFVSSFDFSKANKKDKQVAKQVLENWRKFYIKAQDDLQDDLRRRFPKRKGEKEEIYQKAIKARSFDILRSFLPAGSTTNLAWHTNLRQAADKMMLLRHYPLSEVREVAKSLEEVLNKHFPNSFGQEIFPTTEKYNEFWMKKKYYYFDREIKKKRNEFKISFSKLDKKGVQKNRELFLKRPLKTELPKFLADLGVIDLEFSLDFGSFRDLQRHRAISQRMPLLTMNLGFEEWYLSELPEKLRMEAKRLLREQKKTISSLKLSKEDKQYLIPMGYKVSNKISANLPALIYMVELRGTRFVHPTLRKRALQIAEELQKKLDIPIHLDEEPNRFDVGRGEQDIVLKK